MSDPIERLRVRNPVDPSTLEIPESLEARALTPPPARRPVRLRVGLGLAVALVMAVTIAIVLVAPSATVPTAARAYAAVSPDGQIIHWRDVITNPGGEQQATEGWMTADVRHVVSYQIANGQPRLTSDTRVADGRQQVWTASNGDTTSGPDIPDDPGSLPTDTDPAAIFRDAYRAGRLHQINNSTFTIDIPPCCTGTYHLDPDTELPTKFVFTTRDGSSEPTIVDVMTYEHLPKAPNNLAKLAWLDHPGLNPLGPAAQWFAALRSNEAPSGSDRTSLAAYAAGLNSGSRSSASVDDARHVAGDAWLLPAADHLCLAVIGFGHSVAGTCAPLAFAERRGLNVNGVMAVPDGTSEVVITFADGTHETDLAKNGIVQFAEKPIAHYELK